MSTNDYKEAMKNQTENMLEIDNNNTKLEIIDMDLVEPNPYQKRKTFDNNTIETLARSILDLRQMQPILITKMQPNGKYYIIDGESRVRALKSIKRNTVLAIFSDRDDKEYLEKANIQANTQRQDFNSEEIFNIVMLYIDKKYDTMDTISKETKISINYIKNIKTLSKEKNEVLLKRIKKLKLSNLYIMVKIKDCTLEQKEKIISMLESGEEKSKIEKYIEKFKKKEIKEEEISEEDKLIQLQKKKISSLFKANNKPFIKELTKLLKKY